MSSPSVLLHLFHGRKTVDQEMDNWGSDGPWLRVKWVHFTYMSTIGIGTDSDEDLLFLEDGLFHYDGVYYGDFEVVADDATTKSEEFEFKKAYRNPETKR